MDVDLCHPIQKSETHCIVLYMGFYCLWIWAFWKTSILCLPSRLCASPPERLLAVRVLRPGTVSRWGSTSVWSICTAHLRLSSRSPPSASNLELRLRSPSLMHKMGRGFNKEMEMRKLCLVLLAGSPHVECMQSDLRQLSPKGKTEEWTFYHRS